MTKDELLTKLDGAKLRKVKSRMMREALEKGSSERGNHKILRISPLGGALEFYYRNTQIACVFIVSLNVISINAGEFENTPSTTHQRKTIQDAVDELKSVVVQTWAGCL